MTISFQCGCGRGFKVPDEAAGKKVKCKGCDALVVVPVQSAQPVSGTKKKVKAGKSSSSEEDYGMDFGLKGDPILQELPPRKSRADAEPKRKKSSQKSNSKAGLIAALVMVGLLVVGGGGYFLISQLGSSAPKEPEVVTYATFTHQDGQFKIKYPSDWKVESGGGQGGRPPYASFEDGTAYISVRHSQKGAPVGDMSSLPTGLAAVPGVELNQEQPSAAKVHDFLTESQYEHDFTNYEETPGKEYEVPYGKGWLVEFTGSEGLSGKLRAYRLTLVGTQWQYNVIAKCPNNKWEKYEPIFKEVLNSMSR